MVHSVYVLLNWRRPAAGLVLAMLFMAISLSDVQAHAIVVRSDPPDGRVVAQAPREIRLWFSEAISPQATRAQVLDTQGQPLSSTTFRSDPADPTLLIVSVPELPDGVYNVVYVALSAADGHTTQGRLVFTVGTGTSTQVAAPTASQPPVAWVEVILRWLGFAALLGMVGAVAAAFVLLGPAALRHGSAPTISAALSQAHRRVLGWAAGCALAALATGVLMLYWQAAALAGPSAGGIIPTAVQVALRVLIATRSGMLWMCRQALLIVLAVLLFRLASKATSSQRNRGWRGMAAMLGLFCIAVLTIQSLAGHAVTVSPNTTLAVFVDVLHLMAASLWVGGLLALVVGLLPLALAWRNGPVYAALAHAGWGSFGRLAALSVGVLIASGLYSMGRQVASLDAMLTTLYGRALILKVALVLGIGVLGLLNSSMLHPRLATPLARLLRRPPGWTPLSLRQLPPLLIAESGLGLLVLLATGIMLTTPPAHGPALAPAPGLEPGVPTTIRLSQQTDDLLVTFEAEPNQPGRNSMSMRVSEGRRPSAEVFRVIVRFAYLGQNLGVVSADAQNVFQGTSEEGTSDGLWQLEGDQLSLTGPWQVDVVVRRKGLEDSTASFKWTVSGPPSARPVILSDQTLEPVLTIAAAVILLAVLLIAVGVWLKRSQSPA